MHLTVEELFTKANHWEVSPTGTWLSFINQESSNLRMDLQETQKSTRVRLHWSPHAQQRSLLSFFSSSMVVIFIQSEQSPPSHPSFRNFVGKFLVRQNPTLYEHVTSTFTRQNYILTSLTTHRSFLTLDHIAYFYLYLVQFNCFSPNHKTKSNAHVLFFSYQNSLS